MAMTWVNKTVDFGDKIIFVGGDSTISSLNALTIETTGSTKSIILNATGDLELNPIGADITIGGVSGGAGKLTIGGTSLEVYGGDTTGDDLVLNANSIDTGDFLSLLGTGDAELSTGTAKIILDAKTDIDLDPEGNDINLLGSGAGKITMAAASTTVYGGDTTGDDLVLQGNTADTDNSRITINGAGNINSLVKDQDFLVSYDGSNYLKTEVSVAGAVTLTPTGASATVSVASDLSATGHSDGREFTANAFQYPNPGTDWTPELNGAGLGANLGAKKCWLPLNFLKIGDEIVSYKITGDAVEAAAITLDCKLVKINLADPITTTDVTGGGIVQVDADGNFDVAATLGSVEVVATDHMYSLEILGTCGAADAITVMGAEVKVNRKV